MYLDENPRLRFFLGFIVPNLLAVLLMGLTALLKINSGYFIFSEFIIVPMLMGMMSAWFWRDRALSKYERPLHLFFNCIIAAGLSALFLHEGAICLLIASPLVLGFMAIGSLIGRRLFERNSDTLNVSLFAVLLFVFLVDVKSHHSYENEVSDEIIINAPPEKVWPNVVAFEPIKQENKFWLFRIGMPSPMATTVTGYYTGAGRKCIFSNGYVFGERIVTFEKNQNLTFNIIDQPRDPEIMGHIDIQRGQFLLRDNGNGTTTLTGNSWYKLYVFPVWYYDIWARSITRNVHFRVMEHIKEISEKN
jgi:hypothetical protein